MKSQELDPKSDRLIFIAKILVASALISIAIKVIGPALPIPATSRSAALIVFVPIFIMAIVLGVKTFFKTPKT
jgi:hypothetical protein